MRKRLKRIDNRLSRQCDEAIASAVQQGERTKAEHARIAKDVLMTGCSVADLLDLQSGRQASASRQRLRKQGYEIGESMELKPREELTRDDIKAMLARQINPAAGRLRQAIIESHMSGDIDTAMRCAKSLTQLLELETEESTARQLIESIVAEARET